MGRPILFDIGGGSHVCGYRDCGMLASSVTIMEHGQAPIFWCDEHTQLIMSRRPVQPPRLIPADGKVRARFTREELAYLGIYWDDLHPELKIRLRAALEGRDG